ncbi:gypsy/ty3 element polyprotein [Cucumis melo var. makuwa]|uniref:Gypsy/ty3 element polyprotein n=1 Tax=Cucumis melo var. makuwa TaxID=1194695 RepID=A0A5A7UWK4_CUCMM|nr:gypsy/ty3 element polyprotein [Cucumis melo var. makuwa]TYJ98543.1 gypsy/ty3 element polyprotein [Cucumis melo var. makuwa]
MSGTGVQKGSDPISRLKPGVGADVAKWIKAVDCESTTREWEGSLTLLSESFNILGRWKKMTQKLIEERLDASETEIEAIKKERQPGGSELIGVSTGKRKIRMEDLIDGDRGETSLSLEPRQGKIG